MLRTFTFLTGYPVPRTICLPELHWLMGFFKRQVATLTPTTLPAGTTSKQRAAAAWEAAARARLPPPGSRKSDATAGGPARHSTASGVSPSRAGHSQLLTGLKLNGFAPSETGAGRAADLQHSASGLPALPEAARPGAARPGPTHSAAPHPGAPALAGRAGSGSTMGSAPRGVYQGPPRGFPAQSNATGGGRSSGGGRGVGGPAAAGRKLATGSFYQGVTAVLIISRLCSAFNLT